MSALEPIQLERLREIGSLLQREREAKGLSLEDVSAKTLIRPTILKAIEEADARPLPEPVYLRGFIRRYGDLVDLPGVELSDSFPWEPSRVVPAAFVASGVTTAESVDETRRPGSLPRSEARVVEPDPVPVVDEDAALPPAPAIEPDSLIEEPANKGFVNPYAEISPNSLDELAAPTSAAEPALPQTAETSATAQAFVGNPEIGTPEQPEVSPEVHEEGVPEAPSPEVTPQSPVSPSLNANPSLDSKPSISESAAAPLLEDPWRSESASDASTPPSSPPAAPLALTSETPDSSDSSEEDSFTPLPMPQPISQPVQSGSSSGLPGGMIALILAAAALGIGVAFALSNRGSQPVTEQPSDAPAVESVESAEKPDEPAPAAADSSETTTAAEAASETESAPASEAETATAETAEKSSPPEAKTSSPAATAGDVSVALTLKEPAWFYVEVDGRIVFEGIADEFPSDLQGKQVVIGTSRPDLLLVSVDGGSAKPMGTEPGDKTETYQSGG